jgi:glutamyl-tRNA synthetase
MTVRVRIAPSPTGDPHVGTAFMALFNLIFAKHKKGQFILRIEDTDQSRSRPEYEANIFHALKWCGIEWDEGPDVGGDYGPYRQSERTAIYKEYCQKLLDAGKAYKCFATAEELAEMREASKQSGARFGYDRRYRDLSPEEIQKRIDAGQAYAIRLKVPLSGECEYVDAVKGAVTVPWADVDDQILLKSDGFPTYHLANVVDDYLMKISHVIRGDEWLSSTPKHVLLYDSFGWKPPTFMHIPLLLGLDGKKLSKRKNPTSIFYFRDSGYLPEAFVNFLTLMAYSLSDDREFYPLETIIEEFDVKRIGVSPAIFDTKKLDWLNQQYLINSVPEDQLWDRYKEWAFPEDKIAKLMPLVYKRLKTFGDFFDVAQFLFVNDLHYTEELFSIKSLPKDQLASLLQAIIWTLDEKEDWGSTGLEAASREIAERFSVHHKKVIMPLLFASLTGKKSALPLFSSVEILGKDRCRARFLQAIEFLGGISKKKMSQLKKAWDQNTCENLFQA